MDALVAMLRSLPLGDIWQATPALPPPQRRGGRSGASDAPSPSEQALQVRLTTWRPGCRMQLVTGMQVCLRSKINLDLLFCKHRSQQVYLQQARHIFVAFVVLSMALCCDATGAAVSSACSAARRPSTTGEPALVL